MENIGITYQAETPPTTPTSFTSHLHPFTTLPELQSHVHPKFAILTLDHHLNKINPDDVERVLTLDPFLPKVWDIYQAWTRQRPKVDGNQSYKPDDSEDDDPADFDYLENWTIPHRVKPKRRQETPPRKRKRGEGHELVEGVSHSNLVDHESQIGKGGWTTKAMANWAQDCTV